MIRSLVLSLALAATQIAASWNTPAHAQERIKIGVSLPLSGNVAPAGTDLKNTLIFANSKIANDRYELIFEDDRCTGKDAVTIAHRFVDVLKLKYITGLACSTSILSSAHVYEKAEVLTMVLGGSAAEVSDAGTYIFRTWPSDAEAAKVLHNFIAKTHTSVDDRIGVMTEQTDYPESFLRSFAMPDSRLTIFNEHYLSDEKDYRSSLLRLRQKGATALFINSQSELTFIAILRQIQAIDWKPKIYSAYWAGSSESLKTAPELLEGIHFVDLPSPDSALTPDGKGLFTEFVRTYGPMNSVEQSFLSAYEGFRALDAAIRSQEEGASDVRAFLMNTKFNGVIGNWHFDENGDIVGPSFVMKVVRDGKVSEVSP